ncbi:uncharacterized protein L201_003577 [Kwoniella dendrophila CBS 6074]|uniref:AMP-binding protein n=1 Tax=Kwoniella dendrophila CBS 6074 TaxID=1295534 RepID=A0AAX4JTL0_9TREE
MRLPSSILRSTTSSFPSAVASSSRIYRSAFQAIPIQTYRYQSTLASQSKSNSDPRTKDIIPLPNGYTFYPNHNDTPFDIMVNSSSKSSGNSDTEFIEGGIPRKDQIYTSDKEIPFLPRISVYHYLFPFKTYKSKHRTRFLYYPEPTNQEKPKFIDASTGKFLTRSKLEEVTKTLATGLKIKGIKQNEDIGCIFGMNSLNWVIANFACQALGIIVSPANYAYTPDELLHQLRDSTSSFAFVQPSLLPTFLKAIELDPSYSIPDNRIYLLCDKDEKQMILEKGNETEKSWMNKFQCIEELYENEKPGQPKRFQDGMEEKTAYLCYSSGTTGKGKGVETSHHNMTSQVQAFNVSYEPIKYHDVILAMLPFSHIYLIVCFSRTLHQPLTCNGTVVILPRFEELAFLKAVEKYKVTWALVVPPMLIALLHSNNVSKFDISSIRGFMSGAAPLSSELIRSFEDKFKHIKLTQGYGLTETTPVTHVMNLEESKNSLNDGKIGKLMPTYQARLISQQTSKDLNFGNGEDRGELWLRGPSVMKGYWKNQQATNDVFAKGGWFKTGDIATIDKRGYFSIVDRVKELIKYKGFQVPPAELEALLLTHPEITDVGVIGIYSREQATELPRAYVVPKGGLSSLPTSEDKAAFSTKIQEWVNGKVANHKKLRGGVVLLDQIPKSPSGKILRKDLRAKAIKDEEERVQQGRVAKL